ncbi:hypothetical protein Srufu_019480 [Streptomyces libani subsp. rufus]|nr:hypothetical protein Srufu_019480 [Streptomyces libani subsp. rufus]
MSGTITAAPAAGPGPSAAGPARLSVSTVRQFVAARSKLCDGAVRVMLLRAAPQWDGTAEQPTAGGTQVRVTVAPSVLAVHEQILDHLEAQVPPEPRVLVVLTDRENTELDPGLLARVYSRRIRSVDNWEVVQEAFGASGLDTRLRGETWAAEALLDAAGTRGWRSIGRGVLSRDEALTRLTRRRLRLDDSSGDTPAGRVLPGESDRVDPVALFRWTLTPGGPDLLRELRGPEKAGLAHFLAAPEQGGSTGRVITALVDAEHGPDAAAYAVVCAALWGHAEADHDLYRARGRAERWLGEQPPAQGDELDRLLVSFARSGEAYVRDLINRGEHRLADPVLTRAAQLVAQFGAQAAATASPLLPAGLDARFTAAGHALTGGSTEAVTDSVTALRAHALATVDGETRARIERVRMAVRLRRWLAGKPSDEIESVTDGTGRQIRELGWADRALEHLEAGGDPDSVLAAAYSRIGDQARRTRRTLDHAFSERLAVWTADGSSPGSLLTVESLLTRVVAPVVAEPGRRVLLLLLDGMSAAIAAELGQELREQWAEFDPLLGAHGAPVRRAAAAALPTLTAVSRTSLFAGTLMKGDQNDEKRLFPQHSCWQGAPAAVFHKDDLRGPDTGSPFSTALGEALADERMHVAVVLNTVDDRLAKEQKLGDGAWQTKEVGGLEPLLRAARANGMTVLLTSDHGHVIERRAASSTRPQAPSVRPVTAAPAARSHPPRSHWPGRGWSGRSPARASSLCATTTPGTPHSRRATTAARPSPNSPSRCSPCCPSAPNHRKDGGSWATRLRCGGRTRRASRRNPAPRPSPRPAPLPPSPRRRVRAPSSPRRPPRPWQRASSVSSVRRSSPLSRPRSPPTPHRRPKPPPPRPSRLPSRSWSVSSPPSCTRRSWTCSPGSRGSRPSCPRRWSPSSKRAPCP